MKKLCIFLIIVLLPFISSFGTLINPFDNTTNLSYVPYNGATSNVNLGANHLTLRNLTATKVDEGLFNFVKYYTGGTWKDTTTEAGIPYGTVSGDVLNVINDYFAMGKSEQFTKVFIDIGTALGGTVSSPVLIWQYSLGGGSWGTLSVTDGTSITYTLQQDGSITFTPPLDWVTDSLDGSGQLYFIRVLVYSGTFSIEPTVYLVAPVNEDNIIAVYATADTSIPSLLVDKTGGVAIGYSDTSTYRLRVLGNSYLSGSLAGVTTGAFSNTVTSTPSTSSISTSLTPSTGFLATTAVATALLPLKYSASSTWLSETWTGSSRTNAMDIIVKPSTSQPSNARMVFKDRTVNDYENNAELMSLTTDGELNLLGRARNTEDMFDAIRRYISATAAWTDYTFECSSFGVNTGDMLNLIGDYIYIGKYNKFLEINVDLQTAKSATGVLSFEYSKGGGVWQTLSVSDGTSGLTVDGVITFSDPGDWAIDSGNNADDLYWVRIGVESGTFTIEPTFRFCTPNTNMVDSDILSNGEFDGTTNWEVTGDWGYTTGDYTFTYNTGTGTLKQLSTNFTIAAKPNTWYRFRFVNGVAGPSGTVAWIGTEFANEKIYFTTSTTEYPVYFKTNSNPGDFIIYTNASTTSGFRIDAISLIELTGGNFFATGGAIFGGNVGIGMMNTSEKLQVAGNIFLQNDSDKLYFGQAKDVSQTMDGTSFNITNEVGSISFYFKSFLNYFFDNDVKVGGDLNVTGNFTGNQIYGEMWYHNHTGTTIDFAVQNQWYPLFFTDNGLVNGFTYTGGFNSSSNLTAQIDGLYKVCYLTSGSGQNNHEYFITILINTIEQVKCSAHKKMAAGGDITTINGCCFIELSVGDNVQLAIEDYSGTGNGEYFSSNLNIVRIGN